jgi:hypothetical protein
MKKIITMLLVGLISHFSFAQTTSPQVIASSGWFTSAGGYSLSQTIGEMAMVQTFSQGNTTLTQGFQQADKTNTAILDFTESGGAMDLFPNPAIDYFKLNYEFPKEGELTISIYNAIGQKVSADFNDNYSSGQKNLHITTSDLSAGIYYIQATFITTDGEQYKMSKKLEILK